MNRDFASAMLSRCGVRFMELDGVMTVGVWSWLDCLTLREAITTYSPDAPIRYLDGNGIPDQYKEFLGAPELNREPPIRNPAHPPELGWELPILPEPRRE